MSSRLISDVIWTEIDKIAKTAKVRKAVIAYVTTEFSSGFREHDVLITDASEAAIASGSTDARVLQQAVEAGAAVYSLPGLHAKLMRFDATVIVGSANLSANSRNTLIEAAIVSDDEALVAQVDMFLKSLANDATRLTSKTVAQLAAIPVIQKSLTVSTRNRTFGTREGRSWILGLPDMEMDADFDAVELAKAEVAQEEPSSEISEFYWSKTHRFAKVARVNDLIYSIWRPDFRDKSGRNIRVYRPCHIKRIIPAGKLPDIGFVVATPRGAEAETVSWTQFKDMVAAAAIKRVGPDCAVEISDRQRRVLSAKWPLARVRSRR